MTFDEALRELELEPHPTSDAARRAYLRLLKTRKPEVDPEGFKRLRAAYEQVKEGLVWRTRISEAIAERTNEPASLVHSSATASAPDLPSDDTEGAAPDGTPPGLASLEEITRLVQANKPKTAAKRMCERFAAASRVAGVDLPDPMETFDVIFALHEKMQLASAEALMSSVKRWLHESGEESRALRGVGDTWTIVRELSALPQAFDSRVRAAIASAARTGDVTRARPELAQIRNVAGRQPVTARALQRHAPVLGSMFASELDEETAPPQPGTARRFSSWGLVPLIIAIVRVFSASTGPSQGCGGRR